MRASFCHQPTNTSNFPPNSTLTIWGISSTLFRNSWRLKQTILNLQSKLKAYIFGRLWRLQNSWGYSETIVVMVQCRRKKEEGIALGLKSPGQHRQIWNSFSLYLLLLSGFKILVWSPLKSRRGVRADLYWILPHHCGVSLGKLIWYLNPSVLHRQDLSADQPDPLFSLLLLILFCIFLIIRSMMLLNQGLEALVPALSLSIM